MQLLLFRGSGPGELFATATDVTDPEQAQSWVQRTVQKFGKVDSAANLAGVVGRGTHLTPTAGLEDDDWDFVIGVNLTGIMHSMRVRGYVNNAPYVASKHGVVGLTRPAAKECGARGIRVNAIAPGLIDAPILHKVAAVRGRIMDFEHAIKGWGTTHEIAELVVWLLSDSTKFISGSVQVIDGA
ncbi:uncharacterized protein A1O5_12466 [Cladophialophora psammophila CBS 110553]|uniref:3-oxoacyl-[acyl-carrier protein] reductase n=1 Tax=Cladophialophora psammophila CBS 110553 TaxID=1182543 RepID=W9VZJ2_9EURO|nr:uncharacterized protein A1O5_12466 [Cladophialophora psammophila CBS 110553]EXJ57676.1 hypothetical protein A1O5_12466 [Cladophialophora psammophila CBS 110553]